MLCIYFISARNTAQMQVKHTVKYIIYKISDCCWFESVLWFLKVTDLSTIIFKVDTRKVLHGDSGTADSAVDSRSVWLAHKMVILLIHNHGFHFSHVEPFIFCQVGFRLPLRHPLSLRSWRVNSLVVNFLSLVIAQPRVMDTAHSLDWTQLQ